MATISDAGPSASGGLKQPPCQLAVSLFDRVTSLLIALLVLTGVTVLGLLIIFFTSRIFARNKAVPVTLATVAGRPQGAAFGASRDLEPPGVEELPDLAWPQLQETLNSLTDAVSSAPVLLDDRAFAGELLSGEGRGLGDSRPLGTGSEGIVERVPRGQRWEIWFPANRLESYARQLDFFGIELAAIGADNQIHYAYNLSKATPDRRVGPPESDRRLYMTWRSGALIQADQELLERAGVTVRGRILLQFYPADTEDTLATQERQYAEGHDVSDIRKTVFSIKEENGSFSFFVVDQKYF